MESSEHKTKVSVLVVDDSESIREIIVLILSGKGHQCESATNGVEAIEKCRENTYDAVITDLDMPRMDGITLTRELTRSFLGLPVMMMTAHESESIEESAMNAGAREFLRKPFEISELLMKFDRMLRVQREPEAQQNREQGK